MKSTLSVLVAASTLAFLTACGGSGDDDRQVIPPGSALAVTSTNQTSVARASVNWALSVGMAQGALSGGGFASPQDAGRSHAMSTVIRRALETAGRKTVASVGAHPAAVSSSQDNCPAGGAITTTFDDKDGNQQVTAGDVITATFAQCRESATNIVNGAVAITIVSTPVVTATTSQLVVNADFQTLGFAEDGVSYVVNGLVAISENDDDTTSLSHYTMNIGASGFQVGVASTAYNDTVTFGMGAVVSTIMAYDGSSASIAMAGTMSSTSLGGAVTVATLASLTGAANDPYPSAGQLLITGASDSKLRLTVIDDTQVRLELDADGDGTYETTSVVPWSTLVP